MASYSGRSRAELEMERKRLLVRYEHLLDEGLKLDMSRG